jgi:ATP phosphoribosyltransferase
VDAVHESRAEVRILGRLGLRYSEVVIASSKIKDLRDLSPDDVVVTEYRHLGSSYFEQRGHPRLEFRYVSGAAEAYAAHPKVACIVTLRTSGASIEANGLTVLDVVLKTEACLIVPKTYTPSAAPGLEETISRLLN